MKKNPPMFTVVTVNWNTADFLEVMLEAFTKLSTHEFLFYVMDNGSCKKDMDKLVSISKKYPQFSVRYRQQNKTGSINHAEALDLLIPEVHTPYTVVMDADCTFLMKGWDEYCISQLDESVKIIGTELGAVKEVEKKNNFVFPFAAFFETKTHRDLNTSSMPGDRSRGQDTCWQWKRDHGAAGYEHKIFSVRNTRTYKGGPFKDIISAEYYTQEGTLIANHFSRGSTLGASKYASKIPIPYIRTFIGKQIGAREKKTWIETCRNIINNQ